jgi:hypothetical protein
MGLKKNQATRTHIPQFPWSEGTCKETDEPTDRVTDDNWRLIGQVSDGQWQQPQSVMPTQIWRCPSLRLLRCLQMVAIRSSALLNCDYYCY